MSLAPIKRNNEIRHQSDFKIEVQFSPMGESENLIFKWLSVTTFEGGGNGGQSKPEKWIKIT